MELTLGSLRILKVELFVRSTAFTGLRTGGKQEEGAE